VDKWIDKGFQEKEDAQEDIDVRTESLAQLMEDSQGEVAAGYEARVEAVRHMVKEAKHKAEAEEMKRKAEAAEREAQAAAMTRLAIEVARLQVEWARVTGRPVVNSELQNFAKSQIALGLFTPNFKLPAAWGT
jgi:hypothetical protein